MYKIKIKKGIKTTEKRKQGVTKEEKGQYRNKNKQNLNKARNNDMDIKRNNRGESNFNLMEVKW